MHPGPQTRLAATIARRSACESGTSCPVRWSRCRRACRSRRSPGSWSPTASAPCRWWTTVTWSASCPRPTWSHSSSLPTREPISRDLEALLAAELGPPSPYRVTVRNGVVDLTGPPDPVDRRLATLLARGVPGVLEVRLDE